MTRYSTDPEHGLDKVILLLDGAPTRPEDNGDGQPRLAVGWGVCLLSPLQRGLRCGGLPVLEFVQHISGKSNYETIERISEFCDMLDLSEESPAEDGMKTEKDTARIYYKRLLDADVKKKLLGQVFQRDMRSPTSGQGSRRKGKMVDAGEPSPHPGEGGPKISIYAGAEGRCIRFGLDGVSEKAYSTVKFLYH